MMKHLTKRNVFLCVIPAVVVLLSMFWFKKKKRKLAPSFNQNASTIPKTIALDSPTCIHSSVDGNSDFSNTISDASSISSPENSIRNSSTCETSRVEEANSSEVYSVSNVIECLKIQDISVEENKVYANHNFPKEKPENVSKIEVFQADHILANGGDAVDEKLETFQSSLPENISKAVHSSADMLQSSFSYDQQNPKSLNHSVGLSNGICSEDFDLEDQHSSDVKNSGFADITEQQISKFENPFLTSVLNVESKSNLPELKKLNDADSHSSENSLSSISDESDRHADFKSKDSPSSVFDGNSIYDESEKTDGSNDNLKIEENGNNGYVSYERPSELNKQYSVQVNKNSFFASSLLSNEAIFSSTVDEKTPCLQNSDPTLCNVSDITLEPVCDSNDIVLEYHNQHLLKEADSCRKELSSDIKTVSSTSEQSLCSCNQTERQSEAAVSCDTKVSSSVQETIQDEDPKLEQPDSISSVQSTISETFSVKSQDSQFESVIQSKVSVLDMADIKSSGMIPGLYVYEFDLPQELCGRLIGKQGKYVKGIKERTNANILIKRHPFDNNLKTVVVEGNRTAVFEALDAIRRKFPPSQFPTVTLLQTNMMSSHAVAIPESLQLHLPEGASCDVILSSLVSAGHFFLQQPTHPTYPSLSTLDQCMISCYSQMDTPLLPHPVEAGVICAAPIMNGWFRAQVIYVFENANECEIKFVDYGGFSQVLTSSLRQIRSDFMTLPFQASECYLANVRPVDRNAGWSAEATSVFEELAQGQILQALLVEYAEDGTPCVHLYRVQGVSNMFINQELVERGLAVWVDNGHWDPH